MIVRLEKYGIKGRDVMLSTAWNPQSEAQEAREVIETLGDAIDTMERWNRETIRLIFDTPEGLRYVEAPDKDYLWASVEAYDAIHGTRLYDLGEGKIWPDDRKIPNVPPADPDEIKAWFGE